MKKINLSMAIMVIIVKLGLGQNVQNEASKTGNVSTEYSRNAITTIIVNNGGSYMEDLKKSSTGIIIPSKFDNNQLEIRYITTKTGEKAIKQALIDQNIPNEIIAKWFSRDEESGKLDMRMVHERGMYNATDDEVKRASGSKIGLAKLKDAGELLINHSYILMLEFSGIESLEDQYNAQDKQKKAEADKLKQAFDPVKRRKNGWVGNAKGYLYRLNFNDSIMNIIYNDLWIYDDDDSATSIAKKEKFNQIKFPLHYVMSAYGTADGSQFNQGEFLAPPTQLNREELFSKMINTGMNAIVYEIERKVEEFKVKTPLYGTKPLRSKIGKKEGINTEQRFFVYEFQQKRNGETKANRKGVVRAKTVVDNREVATGNSQLYTTFYQTAGFGLSEGMLLQQNNDYGVGVSGHYPFVGEISGAYLKVEGNLGVLSSMFLNTDLGLNQVKVYAAFGGQTKEYTIDNEIIGSGEYEMVFGRFMVGLSKGWYFANNFSIVPFIGYAMETASNDDLIEENDWEDGQNIGSDFVHWGAYSSMNITHNIQIIGTVDLYSVVGTAYNKDREEIDGSKYNEIFSNRSGISIDLGVRLEF